MSKSGIGLSAAAAAAALAFSSPSQAEPLRIGYVGAEIPSTSFQGLPIEIERASFLDAALGRTAGPSAQAPVSMLSAFASNAASLAADRPLKVFSSNPYYEVPGAPRGADGLKPSAVNFDAASKSLDWFHQNAVNTVVVGFSGGDTPGMKGFMAKAKSLDMIVIAGDETPGGGKSYPSAYLDTMSVGVGNDKGLCWAGTVVPGAGQVSVELGRLAAISAAMRDKDPSASAMEILTVRDRLANPVAEIVDRREERHNHHRNGPNGNAPQPAQMLAMRDGTGL